MGINKYNIELESYFSGELSGADRILFEGRVESDPAFKAAFDHQNNIVEGLTAHRIAELKSRLNNISVEPTILGALMQRSIMKSVTLGVTGLIVAVGTYFYYINNNNSAIEYHIQGLEGKKEYSLSQGIELKSNYNLDYKFDKTLQMLDFVETNRVLRNKEIKREEEIVRQSQPVRFEVPQVSESEYSENIASSRMDVAPLDRMKNVFGISDLEKVNIQTINSRKYNFHYRLEGNRLFLYGKFGISPYEIIEVSSLEGNKLFFYYQNNFYWLKKSSSISSLSKIENIKLVQQLEVIKKRE